MKITKIYLDTSTLNFFFEEADLEKANSTKELFREIHQGKYLAFISELVLREIDKAPRSKREKIIIFGKNIRTQTHTGFSGMPIADG